MGYTLEQLQQMGATPVPSNQVASTPNGTKAVPKKKYTLEELSSLGAKPVEGAVSVQKTGSSKLNTAAKVADTIFGSGQVGEVLGTGSARNNIKTREDIILPDYANLPESVKQRLISKGVPITEEAQRQEVANTIQGPSTAQVLGSVGQSALLFTPAGRVAGAAESQLAKLGAKSALAKYGGRIAAGTAEGYGVDVASNIAEGDQGFANLKPGMGTAFGAGTPLAFPVAIGALRGGKKIAQAVPEVAKSTAPVAKAVARGTKNIVGAPIEFVANKAKEAVKISKLPQAERVLANAGIDEGTRGFLQSASTKTKEGFKKMVDIMEKRTNFDPANPNTTGLRLRTQPKKVVGDALLERAEVITKDSAKARKVINAASLGKGDVDLGITLNKYMDDLEKKGISVGKDGKLVSTGRTPRSDLPYYESIFKEIQDVTGGRTKISRLQAHRLRQRLRDTLDAATRNSPAGATGQRPFSNLVDNDITSLRGLIADQMGDKYKTAAKQFAENESVLKELAKFAGVPNDWEKLSAKNLKLGEVLMRTLGNASDKPKALLELVEAMAKKRGGKFGDNVNDLIDFADNLEDLYGITQTRGFEGGIQRGVNQSGVPTLPTTVGELAMKALQASTKTTNQDKINALKAFLGK